MNKLLYTVRDYNKVEMKFLFVLFSFFLTLYAHAYDFEVGGLYYTSCLIIK